MGRQLNVFKSQMPATPKPMQIGVVGIDLDRNVRIRVVKLQCAGLECKTFESYVSQCADPNYPSNDDIEGYIQAAPNNKHTKVAPFLDERSIEQNKLNAEGEDMNCDAPDPYNNRKFVHFSEVVMTEVGTYNICVCMDGTQCTTAGSFKVLAGADQSYRRAGIRSVDRRPNSIYRRRTV